jgi:hypothetical protein
MPVSVALGGSELSGGASSAASVCSKRELVPWRASTRSITARL